MHFDDRLDTVLKQPVRGQAIARIQYVQLLDLLGKTAANTGSARLDPAYERLSSLAAQLPAGKRAGLLRASGLKLRSPALVAFLADDVPDVASAAVAAAELSEREWLDLVPALPVGARGVLRHRRDLGPNVEARLNRLGVADRGLPPAPVTMTRAAPVPEPGRPPAATRSTSAASPESPRSEIGALVRRIEAYRKAHPIAARGSTADDPRLPLGDPDIPAHSPLGQFDFVSDASGQVVHADSAAAPMLVGMSLRRMRFRPVASDGLAPPDALDRRQPIEGQVVEIEGSPAIEGDWRIDAAPLFDAATGRYIGHAGRARRLSPDQVAAASVDPMADRMRQVLHELRNPAGAIQMASEYIQQQVGGAVSHEYRSLAAAIASDTATVLAGLEELDRLVRHEAGIAALEPGETDLAAAVAATVRLLDPNMAQRESGFALDLPEGGLPVDIAPADLDRLVWRLLAALANATGPIERLDLIGRADRHRAVLEIGLPASLHEASDEELFAAQTRQRGPALSAGVFGLGFTLRLAAAEARSAGGSLRREGARMLLELPATGRLSANVRSS